jgi:hypothetical protein
VFGVSSGTPHPLFIFLDDVEKLPQETKHRGEQLMSLKSAILSLMGTSYAEQPIIPAPAEPTSQVVRQMPVEAPEPVMAMEEVMITALRRAEFLADSPVLSADDPAVRAASFRNRFEPAQAKSWTAKQARARLEFGADIPVASHPAPLIASAALDRSERLAMRIDYQNMTPVMRRVA